MASPERKKKKGAKDAATPPASREASAEPRGRSEKKDKKDKKKKKDKSASKEGRSKSKDKKKGKKDRSASKGKKKGVQEEEPAKENKVEEAPKEPLVLPDRCGEEDRLRTALMAAFDGDEKELAKEIETMPTFVSPCGVTINWIPANSERTQRDPSQLLKPRRVPLHRLFRFLEYCGETFEGGFPYDKTKWAALQELIRKEFNVSDSQVSALCRPTCPEAAKALDAAFYPANRGDSRGQSLEHAPTRATAGPLADSPRPGRVAAAAALMAHGVAMGRLYLVAHLDAHACNAPDEHGDRPLAIAAMGERPKAILALLSRARGRRRRPARRRPAARRRSTTRRRRATATSCASCGGRGSQRDDDVGRDAAPLREPPARERGPEAVEVARVLMDHGASPDGFADERNAHAEPPPPPPAEEKDDEDKGKKGKKKGSSSKKASKGSSKKAKKEEKNDDEPPPPPPPDRACPTSRTWATAPPASPRGALHAPPAANPGGDYHTAVTIAGRVARAPEPPPHAYDMLQALRTNLHLPAPTKPKPEKKGGGKKSSGGKKGGAKKKKKRQS
ncbi:hypothetical protein JL721_6301 [Aureococcus anophagefferens]|nr:hypothetical protein JL721_6301 [Aureococcus anophagefferens]